MATALNQAKATAFAERMLGTLNEAFLAMMVSIGQQTRLFDTMEQLSSSTSNEIARAAGLHERYVREWLGSMVTGRIVEYEPASDRYALPPEHAARLTTRAGLDNVATLMLWVSCMGEVETKVAQAFRSGGGVDYSCYERFHGIMKQVSAQIFDETLVSKTLPLVPGLVDKLEQGITVLDVGCGSGHAINLMARTFPKSRFLGYDFSEGGIAQGRAEAEAWELCNAEFAVQDVAKIADVERFDFVTAFDAIHDQAHPQAVLAHVARALRPDGSFLMVDIRASSRLEDNLDHPLGPFFYSISTMHCMTVSLALGGEGLGTVWGEQRACQALAEAGFQNVSVHQVPGDIVNNYYVAVRV